MTPIRLHVEWLTPALGLVGGDFFDGTDLATAVEMLIAAKLLAGRRQIYLKSLSHYLRRFIKGRENLPLCHLRLEDVEGWIAKQPSAHSRSTYLNRISALFAFAVKRGWVLTNLCDKIERISIDAKEIRILSPAQASALVRATPARLKPYLALCLYAGVRPTEAQRLDWSAVDLTATTVIISEAASKVCARRVVPLCKLAVKLLEEYPDKQGQIAPPDITVRRWKRSMRDVVGGVWTPDILRHTALSYHLAMCGDVGKVATMAGNSVAILKKHYDAVVSRAEAERFFAGVHSPPGPC